MHAVMIAMFICYDLLHMVNHFHWSKNTEQLKMSHCVKRKISKKQLKHKKRIWNNFKSKYPYYSQSFYFNNKKNRIECNHCLLSFWNENNIKHILLLQHVGHTHPTKIYKPTINEIKELIVFGYIRKLKVSTKKQYQLI